MALLTVTMTVSVNCLGPEPPDLWNSYNWNAFVWGAGTAPVPKIVVRLLPGQSITGTAAENYRLVKLLPGQSIAGATALGKNVTLGLPAQTLTPADKLSHEYLQDPNGYYHVFPEQVTDFTLSTTPSWSQASSTPVSWTSQAVQSTTWS